MSATDTRRRTFGERLDDVFDDDGVVGADPVPPPSVITAPALMGKVFPDPRWAVAGLFAEGLSLLVGAPKLGKSWLALNVGVAVGLGGRALGAIPVDPGEVLYVSLEDTQRRLQERLRTALEGAAPPAGLHFATTWPMVTDGGAVYLDAWLATHPAARLVVIDTFQRLRGPIPVGQNLYAADYAAAGALKQLADRHGVAVVLVHHTRKAGADDPLDTVSGTAGLAGAADTTLGLRREIGRADAALYIRGRDVAEADHALRFDPETCAWTMLGGAAEFRQSEERRGIVDLLRTAPDPLSPKRIAEALGKKDGAVRYLLHKMLEAGTVENVGGAYRLPPSPPNTPNTANAPPAVRGVKTPPNATPNSSNGLNDAEKAVTVSTVRGVRGKRGDLVGVPGQLFDDDLLFGGEYEVCGAATTGESLCWSCR
jgi:hypothetical protein